MNESTPRMDREQMNSSLNNQLSEQSDYREAQRCVIGSRTVITVHRKQQCKARKHRAQCCMSQDTSGACSCHRFLSSAPQSGEEHLHREQAGDIADAASRSAEDQLMNAEVQNDGNREDDKRVRTKCSIYHIITIFILLAVLVFKYYMTCTVRWWCY